MLDRHDQVFGRYPLNVSFDGGFASTDNLKAAKSKGNQKCVLCEEAWSEGKGHVPKQMGIQKTSSVQGRYRIRYFVAQEKLWFLEMYLEILSVFQELCMVQCGFCKSVYPRKARNGLTRGGHRGKL